MSIKEKVSRIPWKEYLSKQFVTLVGLSIVTLMLIAIMILSADIDLSTVTISDNNYLIAIILSSICFFLVLFGFSKIVLIDMANEFGLRDENEKMVYNSRFFLFALLALSFCSAIYLTLDVFLQETYLELFPTILMRYVIDSFDIQIEGLSDLTGREYYQTSRNIWFAFFFAIIILFSILVFLSILTSYARKRLVGKFQKEEETEEVAKKGTKAIYKLFAWIIIPFLSFFVMGVSESPLGPIIGIVYLIAVLWWFYQVFKAIFLVVWRSVKITAFITSINLLVIIPLIGVLWLLPTLLWAIWDTYNSSGGSMSMNQLINMFLQFIVDRILDFEAIIQVDFIIITTIATLVVGFAQGFAILAIFSALARGAEVARTGQLLARSPPKIMVLSKYLVMLGVWLSLVWDSFLELWQTLISEFHFNLPDIDFPNFFYAIYYQILIPFSEWLGSLWPILQFLPFLILPVYFIVSGAFKFMSVTLVTPRVKDRSEVFFLLVATSFVLIITNMLGDIYDLGPAVIPDAPLVGVSNIFSSAVGIFENVEALAFYGGFLFGVFWVIRKAIQNRNIIRREKGDQLIQTITEIEEKEEDDKSLESTELDLPSQSVDLDSHETETEELEV
ncbi:MAG: hypothetical protein ACXAC6_01930 [Candidatus Hodarchaeales archaeon]|jgi:hypothetical protein